MTSDAADQGPDLADLLAFGRRLIDLVAVAPEPAVYGGLAYAIHTGDRGLGLNDIDLLVPEATFPAVLRALAADPSLSVEETSYHTLKVSRGPLRVSFDSLERYLAGIDYAVAPASFDGQPFLAIDRRALARCYERGAETIPQKRDAYLAKLRRLRTRS